MMPVLSMKAVLVIILVVFGNLHRFAEAFLFEKERPLVHTTRQ